MRKSHGPALMRRLIPMTECPSCIGKGVIKGVFHELDCVGCHASGLVHAVSLEPLPLEDLAVQLGKLLRRERRLATQAPAIGGVQNQYNENNRRGAGGSNYTGD